MSREKSYLSLEKRLWMVYTWEWVLTWRNAREVVLVPADFFTFSETSESRREGRSGTFQNNKGPIHFFPGRFFGQTAWEESLQEEVWRTFLDKQRSTGKQLQRWLDDRCRFAKWEPYSWAFSKNARALFISSVEQARVLPHLKQLLLAGFAWSFDVSFPAFWDGEQARSLRRPVSRIFFSERVVSQLGKSAHQKTTPWKSEEDQLVNSSYAQNCLELHAGHGFLTVERSNLEYEKNAIGDSMSRSPYKTSTDIMELKLEENILQWRMAQKISNGYAWKWLLSFGLIW